MPRKGIGWIPPRRIAVLAVSLSLLVGMKTAVPLRHLRGRLEPEGHLLLDGHAHPLRLLRHRVEFTSRAKIVRGDSKKHHHERQTEAALRAARDPDTPG